MTELEKAWASLRPTATRRATEIALGLTAPFDKGANVSELVSTLAAVRIVEEQILRLLARAKGSPVQASMFDDAEAMAAEIAGNICREIERRVEAAGRK